MVWLVDPDPIYPLSTSTRFVDPTPVIGPTVVVPTPTLITFIYSLSIFIISEVVNDEIPLRENVVLEVLIPVLASSVLFCRVNDIGTKASGDWITLSRVIIDFVSLFAISNWWSFPVPIPTKVTALPPLVVDIWKVSAVSLIAKTEDGSSSTAPVELWYNIGVEPTPTKVDPGV